MMAQPQPQPFGQFGNMFLAFSQMTIGRGVGLVTPTQEVLKSPVRSPFPDSYRPRLRELLDSLAWQTFCEWKYDPTSRYFQSDVDGQELVDNLAMFEFSKVKREHPFEIDVAKGWTANDKGDWIMYVPPNFIVGMDIYQMGAYSADDSAREKLRAEVCRDVSLHWLRRLGMSDEPDRFQTAKVGAYDALFFDKLISTPDGKQLHWRQWVFMAGDQCYAVISTIFADLDEAIYADVEKMLPTFRIKGELEPADAKE